MKLNHHCPFSVSVPSKSYYTYLSLKYSICLISRIWEEKNSHILCPAHTCSVTSVNQKLPLDTRKCTGGPPEHFLPIYCLINLNFRSFRESSRRLGRSLSYLPLASITETPAIWASSSALRDAFSTIYKKGWGGKRKKKKNIWRQIKVKIGSESFYIDTYIAPQWMENVHTLCAGKPKSDDLCSNIYCA